MFYQVLNNEVKPSGFRPDKTRPASLLTGFKKRCTKSVSLWSPNKGSNCKRLTLANQKKKAMP